MLTIQCAHKYRRPDTSQNRQKHSPRRTLGNFFRGQRRIWDVFFWRGSRTVPRSSPSSSSTFGSRLMSGNQRSALIWTWS